MSKVRNLFLIFLFIESVHNTFAQEERSVTAHHTFYFEPAPLPPGVVRIGSNDIFWPSDWAMAELKLTQDLRNCEEIVGTSLQNIAAIDRERADTLLFTTSDENHLRFEFNFFDPTNDQDESRLTVEATLENCTFEEIFTGPRHCNIVIDHDGSTFFSEGQNSLIPILAKNSWTQNALQAQPEDRITGAFVDGSELGITFDKSHSRRRTGRKPRFVVTFPEIKYVIAQPL